MSEIKYEDIYYMIKDVAYDQEDPIEAYKKIEKELDTATALAEKYRKGIMNILTVFRKRNNYKYDADWSRKMNDAMLKAREGKDE